MRYFLYLCRNNIIWLIKNQKKKKKVKISFSVNEKLLDKFDEFLEENEIQKRSKYIEKLIRDDMERRGRDVSKNF